MGRDFDETQLGSDAEAIADRTDGGGEAVIYSGVTYSGIFAQVNADLTFEDVGREIQRQVVLVVPRASLTAGFPVDSSVYRPWDSTTYTVIKADPDEAWWEYRLVRPY